MTKTTEQRLSDLAEAILEDKWILCTPAECLTYAIDEYLSRGDDNPYTITSSDGDDQPVDPRAFIAAIGELLVWFSEHYDTLDGYA